jgi:hypothetical protein
VARRWDEYVEYEDPLCKVLVRVRCYGPGTAAAIAEQKRAMGFDKVRIIGRPATRRKERISVSHSRIQLHEWSRRGY